MKRLEKWPRLLEAHVNAALGKTFAWGSFDCALAACDAIHAITGVDVGARYRGKYSTEEQAKAFLGDLNTFVAQEAKTLGMAEVPVRCARRGDLVLCDNSTPQGALGIVDLSGRYALMAGSKGLLRVRMARWKRAWRVG